MAALLKSGRMIGENRPTAEVIIGSNAVYDWDNMTNVYYPDYDGVGDECPSVVKLEDGTILYMYTRDGSLYQSIIADLDTLLTQNDSKGIETVILTGKDSLMANVFWANGDLYFICNYQQSGTDKLAKVEIYKSALKDGSDWSLYSTIQSFDWSTRDYGMAQVKSVTIPYVTDEGDWIVGAPYYYSDSGYMTSKNSIVKSVDNGLTWVEKYSYSLGTIDAYTPDHSRNIVEFKGKIYWLLSNIYGADGTFQIVVSDDDGETWTRVIHTTITAWITEYGNSSFYFTMASDSENLYIFDEQGYVFSTTTHPTAITDFNTTEYYFDLDTEQYYGLSITEIDGINVIMTNGTRGVEAADNPNPNTTNQVVGIPILSDTPIQPKSITINRSKGMAGGLTLELDNKSGILAPDGTANPQLLWPNKEVVVKQGYGSEILTTFTGLIDSINMSTFPQSISISARDKMKALLDHLARDSSFSYVLTYTGQTVEAIWQDLITKAGLTYGTVETTGITLTEKVFSWQTYADCISWLDEIAGFETYCDEFGVMHFVYDGRPETVTVAYEFDEGIDIIQLGYDIDDKDLYYSVVVYGKDENDAVIYYAAPLPQAVYWNIPSGKVMRIDAPDADTSAKCQAIADKAIYLMQTRARQVRFSTIGIPHLQRGDFIQVTEASSTISEIYRITDISTSQDASGYRMELTCYYHAAPEV